MASCKKITFDLWNHQLCNIAETFCSILLCRFGYNCASVQGGPWWHRYCGFSMLNGRWGRNHGYKGMTWYTWKKKWGDLKSSMMMVRCDKSTNLWTNITRQMQSRTVYWFWQTVQSRRCLLQTSLRFTSTLFQLSALLLLYLMEMQRIKSIYNRFNYTQTYGESQWTFNNFYRCMQCLLRDVAWSRLDFYRRNATTLFKNLLHYTFQSLHKPYISYFEMFLFILCLPWVKKWCNTCRYQQIKANRFCDTKYVSCDEKDAKTRIKMASNVKTEPRHMHNMLKQNLCDVANYKSCWDQQREAVCRPPQSTDAKNMSSLLTYPQQSISLHFTLHSPQITQENHMWWQKTVTNLYKHRFTQPHQQAHKTYVTMKTTHQSNIWNNNLHLIQVERGKKLPKMISDAVLALECYKFRVAAEVARIILYVK